VYFEDYTGARSARLPPIRKEAGPVELVDEIVGILEDCGGIAEDCVGEDGFDEVVWKRLWACGTCQ